jgi:hypothetical protein
MYEQSKADTCLTFSWEGNTLVVLVAWVDDVMILGPLEHVEMVQEQLKKAFMCKHKGALLEYVGRKITMSCDDTGLGIVQFIQPVLIRKLWEEYGPMEDPVSQLPAALGQVLVKGDGNGTMNDATTKMYWFETATYMYSMQWSHPGIFYAVHGQARHMTAPRKALI